MLRAIFENVLITSTIEVSLNLDYEIPYPSGSPCRPVPQISREM